MKKLLFLFTLCVIILTGNVFSQKMQVGFTAGATVSTYRIKAESLSVTSEGKAGVTFGVISNIPIGSSGSFMPELNFVQKGGMIKADGVKDKLTINYLEVPLNFVYNAKLPNGKFFVGAGPALNVGISGKDQWEAEGSSGSDKVYFGKDKDFKRFDAGLNFVTGYIARSGMMVSFNYNTGLSNSVDSGEGDGKFYNRYLGLRIGYLF